MVLNVYSATEAYNSDFEVTYCVHKSRSSRLHLTKTVQWNNDKGRNGTRERSSFFRDMDEIRRKFAQEKLEEDFLLRLESTGRKIIS